MPEGAPPPTPPTPPGKESITGQVIVSPGHVEVHRGADRLDIEIPGASPAPPIPPLPPEMRAQMNPAELEAVRRIMGSPSEPGRVVHRYDERGRRVETRSRLLGPVGDHRKTIVYNDYGDPVEEIIDDERREYDIGDSGELIDRQDSTTRHRSEARFDYEYDDRGNWVKKAVEGGSIERRTLVYYD
jgi:hypothetical protein